MRTFNPNSNNLISRLVRRYACAHCSLPKCEEEWKQIEAIHIQLRDRCERATRKRLMDEMRATQDENDFLHKKIETLLKDYKKTEMLLKDILKDGEHQCDERKICRSTKSTKNTN